MEFVTGDDGLFVGEVTTVSVGDSFVSVSLGSLKVVINFSYTLRALVGVSERSRISAYENCMSNLFNKISLYICLLR